MSPGKTEITGVVLKKTGTSQISMCNQMVTSEIRE